LLLEIYNSEWTSVVPFGIDGYIAFFSAYTLNTDISGIVWTFSQIFKENLLLTPQLFRAMRSRSITMCASMRKNGHPNANDVRVLWYHIKRLCTERRILQKERDIQRAKRLFDILLDHSTLNSQPDQTRHQFK